MGTRLWEDTPGPFKLGTLQQALQVRQYLLDKGYTFEDLAEYVTQFTDTKEPVIRYTESVKQRKEPPPMIALNREERKKFRRKTRR